MKYKFSNRTNWTFQHNPLSSSLEDLQAQKSGVIDLTESNPTRCGFHYPKQLLDALSAEKNLKYDPNSKGMLDPRLAIVDYYKQKHIAIDPEQLILTSSTSEGYSFLLKLLTNPGDHVLIPKPSYPLFQFLLELHDVEFDYYPLGYTQGSWTIDQEAFRDLITPKTKAMILVNPNNPTGSFINSADVAFLNEQCSTNQMAIISDEVFLDYPLDHKIIPQSLAMNQEVLTFVLSGISKILGLPQMKLSWIATQGPKDLVDAALERLVIIADTYLSVNTPVQNALGTWLKQAPQIQQEISTRVKTNLDYLRQTSLNVLDVQGGWYAIIENPAFQGEEDFVLKLLQKEKVLVHPGYFFDFDQRTCLPAGGGYIIVSLLPEPQEFQKAVEKIRFIV